MTNTILNQLKQDERHTSALLLCQETPADTDHWQHVLDAVLQSSSPKVMVLLKVRREALRHIKKSRGRPGWLSYTQHHYAEELAKLYGEQAEKYWTTEGNLKRMWHDLTNLTIRIDYIIKLNNFKGDNL